MSNPALPASGAIRALPARLAGRPPGAIVGLIALAMATAAVWRIGASLGHMLWLDELYTTTLIDTPSLGHAWAGAIRGIDGNPPLYLTLAWAMTHAIPAEPALVLRGVNLVLMAATAAVVYRIGRRVASPLAAAGALAVLPAVDGMVPYALLETRTYALYLFLVAATLAAALRVVDRPRPGRAAALAGIGTLATLAHSFGGFYVLAALGSAALAARDRRTAAALGLAALPSLAALAAWILVSYPLQKAVATPYGWIPEPDLLSLLEALTGAWALTLALALGAALCAVGLRLDPRRSFAGRRDLAALYAALGAFAGLTLAAWLGSQAITPFFVPRYFIPDVLCAALLLVPAAEAARRGARPALAAAALVFCVLFGARGLARDAEGGPIPCLAADGSFLEAEAARGGLPVVAESPHAWLPRIRYAPGETVLYPLDWPVVLGWPDRARNNAMDYHIMAILRDWAAPGSALAADVLDTDAILARHRRFLVLDEAGRAWFDALRARVPLSATLLARNASCRLWEVERGGAGER